MLKTSIHWLRHSPWSAKGRVLLAAGVLAVLAAACTKGTYAVDIFPEQHYQQSFKAQEPPRLSPPEGAVPITGREVDLDFQEADQTANPLPRTQEVLERGAELFRVNCSMCHGSGGRGDGPVGDRLVADGYARPPDLLAAATQDRSDGSMFWIISNGVVVMPQFNLLLPEDDRWAIVQYLRFLAEQQGG